MPEPTSFKGISEQHVKQLMDDARGPHTGKFADDLAAWPSSGISAEEMVARTESLISLAVQATRQDESGRISAMAAKHQIRVDEHPDDLWSRGGRDACAFLADKLMEPIPADQIAARMADLLAREQSEQKGK